MSECDKLKIAEYNEGGLSGADLFAMEEHLKECSSCFAYQKENEKLGKLLNVWEEKSEFGKVFDTKLLTNVQILMTKQQRVSFAFASVWKTAVAFCLMFVVISAYKNTLYDASLQNLKVISKTEFTSKTDIKDFKLFVTHRLCREMAKMSSDQKSLVNYELMLSVPENILIEEQKSDLRELLTEGVRAQEAKRNIALRFLDGTVNVIEETLKVDLSFAAVKGSENVLPVSMYRQATLNFENGKYEAAFNGYYALVYGQIGVDELLSCSSLFRMAFIKDMQKSRDEASFYYKLVAEKYPASAQAVMAGEMSKFSKQKNSLEAKIKQLKNGIEGEGDSNKYFKIAGLYLSMEEFERAAEYYKRSLEKFDGALAARARLNAGWCYKNTGNYKEAAKMFETVTSDKTYKMFADYELSLAYVKLGEFEKAAAVSTLKEENKEENFEIYSTLIKKYFNAVNNGR
ncbi:MAG: hypothetical protein A2231_06740 [Candidatus Firestonebacteria bacterium RIFOXYA2_FULL_40_8]|nr:MAG: hypothetical protein A2231_06740 [Candidatus Firestonebacteria bacterium RIFOXYA2_FULL_40_8]